ncbi:TolC family protein [Flavobacterium glaciei]|uniref:Outer membrane protein TolC n=1 Tax=Flavobacterium glaciei TaxID=386300 RepID=A0A562PHI7_9FLAO|nr:TolC family protein [Flavobacterium glaciei]RDI51334.1 outer membrane protein TolC [Flavobacterium glaciei]TWI43942.1 outer membrane protein TolC [Flavobacterium glaciei]
MRTTIILMTVLLSLSINAQEIKNLTLKDAITYALENKADAKKARLQIEKGEYEIQEVRSRALPQIAANGSLNYNPILQTTVIDGAGFGAPGTTIQAAFGQKWNSTAGVSLNQALYDQAVFIGLKAAKSTREFYQINAQLTEEQVIERVANAYYQVYVTRQNLTVLDNNLKNTLKVKDILKGQYDNGLAKKIDLDRTLVRISNINTLRQQTLNAVTLQENALKFFMGLPVATAISIPETEFEITPSALSLAADTTTRTEYLLLKKNEQLLEYQKKSIEAAYYPSLSLNAGYNFIGQGPEMPWFRKPSDGVYWSDFASVGLNLRVPIFSGFGTKARVSQADNKLASIKVDLEETKLALDLQYSNAKTQIENSIVSINNQKENSKLAQEVLTNTNNNYIQGLASLTDLLEAESELVVAQNNYTTALLDYKLAEIQLIKAKGELKTLTNK